MNKLLSVAAFIFLSFWSVERGDAKLVQDTLVQELSFQEPVITASRETPGFIHVSMPGLLNMNKEGEPVLPVKGLNLLVPAGKKIKEVRISGQKTILPGQYAVEPGIKPTINNLSGPSLRMNVSPNPAIYGSSVVYPPVNYRVLEQKQLGYPIAVVSLSPVEYIPQAKQISYYRNMTVTLVLADDPSLPLNNPLVKMRSLPGEIPLKYKARIRTNQQKDEDLSQIRALVDNPHDADVYTPEVYRKLDAIYNANGSGGSMLASTGSGTSPTIGPIDASKRYKYVIITRSDFAAAFEPLRAARDNLGGAVIVTTDWIYANYPGTRPDGQVDNQTKIRNFIIDAYNFWGTGYVLLGGDSDGGGLKSQESQEPVVPVRYIKCDAPNLQPQTMPLGWDFVPSDVYYSNLDGTFDDNSNGVYGEANHGHTFTSEIDFLSEVIVGRAPVDSVNEASTFVRKTLEANQMFLNRQDPAIENNYFVGELMDFSQTVYGSVYLEQIRLGSIENGFITKGFLSDPQLSLNGNVLYDSDDWKWPLSQLNAVFKSGVGIINHVGHGVISGMMKMDLSDVDHLSNSKYPLIYSEGCYTASFDNSDLPQHFIDSDSIAEHFLNNPSGGASVFIGNTRFGIDFGLLLEDGPSLFYHRQFWNSFFTFQDKAFIFARAAQLSKEKAMPIIENDYYRYVYFCLTYLGDPAMSLPYSSYMQKLILRPDSSQWTELEGNANGLADNSETMNLVLNLTALNLDAAGVQATLSTTNTDVRIDSSVSDFGVIAKGTTKSNASTPFKVKLLSCSPNEIIYFTLSLKAVGYSKTIEKAIQLRVNDLGQPVSPNKAAQESSAISGDKVVWSDQRNGQWDIYLYNLTTKSETRITHNSADHIYPAIFGNRIVWTDNRSGNFEGYAYDLLTKTESKISPLQGGMKGKPSIENDKVVWADVRNGDKDSNIFMYDFISKQEHQITVDRANQSDPVIFGNRICWTDLRNDDVQSVYINSDIYCYDWSLGGDAVQITKDLKMQYLPRGSKDLLVWSDYRAGNGMSDIYLFDFQTNKEKRLTFGNVDYPYADIFDSKILLDKSFGLRSEKLALLDVNTNKLIDIAAAPVKVHDPVISGSKILWTDPRSGLDQIYIYDMNGINNAPINPDNLQADLVGPNEVQLHWQDNSSNEDGFVLERGLDGVGFTKIRIAANGTSYTDSTVQSNTSYYYRVRAYKGTMLSRTSNMVLMTIRQEIPSAPKQLYSANASFNQIDLTWTDTADNEAGFKLERSHDGVNFLPLVTLGRNVTRYTDTGLKESSLYFYRVKSYNALGDSDNSATAWAYTTYQAPAAPTSLSAVIYNKTAIQLTWKNNATNAWGFIIERSLDGVKFSQLDKISNGATSYIDVSPLPATTYYYRVFAFRGDVRSNASNIVSATVVPANVPPAPVSLTATALTSQSVKLLWQDKSNNETAFKIERSLDGIKYIVVASVSANITSYVDTAVTTGGKYYYRVVASNLLGSSPYSNVVTVNIVTSMSMPVT